MALYNNFPVTYQNPYYPVMQQQTSNVQPQQSPNNGIIWVQGEAGAKSYLVAPNTTVQLWDSENQIIYLKSADASGMPSMKVIDYTVRGSNSAVNESSFNGDKYIDELNALKSKIDRLESELSKLKQRKGDKHGKSSLSSDE